MNPTEHGNEKAAVATAQVTLTLQELCTIGMALTAMGRREVISPQMAALSAEYLPPYLTIMDGEPLQGLIRRLAAVYGTTSAAALEQPEEAGEVTADNLIRHFWPTHLSEVRETGATYKRLTIIRGSRVKLPDGSLGLVHYTYDDGERACVKRDTGGDQHYMVRSLELWGA